MNRALIAYRRRATPLHATRATVAVCWCAVLSLSALLTESPVMLGALLACVLAGAAGAGVLGELMRAGRRAVLPIVILTVLVNVLVSRDGLTVFARLGDWGVLGQVNLTVEAVVYGLVFSLRMIVVTLACLLAACTVDPDRLMLSCRRISPHSALTAALGTRLIPVLGQDASRLAEAQRCRPDGGMTGARGRAAILRATVSGALERSLDVAAVLEMRGYGAGVRVRRAHEPISRHDLAFAASAFAILGLSLLAGSSGMAEFSAYPLISIHTGAGGLAIAALLPAAALAPFADRRGVLL